MTERIKNIRRIAILVFISIVVLSSASEVFADELTTGMCGEDIVYSFDDASGTLTLQGEGCTYSYGADDENDAYSSPFYCHSEIKRIVVEEGVARLGGEIFRGCNEVEEIHLPESLQEIGNGAFDGCESLRHVDLPDNVTSIGDCAFSSCTHLHSIRLSNNLDYIGQGAFSYCRQMEQLNLPASLRWIETERLACDWYDVSFDGCFALEEINVDKDNAAYYSDDGVLFCRSHEYQISRWNKWAPPSLESDGDMLIAYPPGRSGRYVVPKTVRAIGKMAFHDAGAISIEIPKTVQRIHYYPFDIHAKYDIIYDGNRFDWNKLILENIDSYAGDDDWANPEWLKHNEVRCRELIDLKQCRKPEIPNQTWTGKSIKVKQKPYLRDVVFGEEYTLPVTVEKTTYKSNKDVGTATVTYMGTGDYKGTVKATFKIVPKGTKILKTSGTAKAAKVTWGKQARQTDGYQIQFAKDKKFQKDKKSFIVKGSNRTVKTCRGLKGHMKYYVRIRSFKTMKGKKYCSQWSKAKIVRTK